MVSSHRTCEDILKVQPIESADRSDVGREGKKGQRRHVASDRQALPLPGWDTLGQTTYFTFLSLILRAYYSKPPKIIMRSDLVHSAHSASLSSRHYFCCCYWCRIQTRCKQTTARGACFLYMKNDRNTATLVFDTASPAAFSLRGHGGTTATTRPREAQTVHCLAPYGQSADLCSGPQQRWLFLGWSFVSPAIPDTP